jgi:serine/threonine protein kinase/tetratricopeptide (TPR) repeat protein
VTTASASGDSENGNAAPLTGILANRYQIEREIGEGGMATVYLARDLNRDTLVAVKAPKPELVMQLGPERFAREIQIATKLQHPLIVPVLDSGLHNGVPFYVMAYIDGETLEQRLTRTGPLPIDEAIAITCDVLDGLVYAHRIGFVHRDVKPSNVLLSGDHALLADFGIARAVERTDARRLTESGFALGTAEYMSPEQAAGDQQLDGRSDIYSVACVLYEMLAGGPPFTGPTARAVMARHFVDPVPSLRTVRDTVPVKLEQAILTAMAKTPVDRFADATAFRSALRDPTLRHEVPTAARVVAPRTASRWRVIAAACIAVTAVISAVLWRGRDNSDASLDMNRVMVYPFVLPDGFTGSRTIGEDVATIIGNALDNAEPLRWIDGWSLLDVTSRENIRTVSNESARALARKKRCASFVTGRLVSAGDSVKVLLTLHDVRGDSVLAQGEATGSKSDPWRQGLSAVSGILPRLIPGSSKNVSDEWRNRNPGAVANFLLGESAFRRVRVEEALAYYRKAVSLDSTFSVAAIRGAQAAAWNHKSSEATALITVALAQPLAPRYEQFALGFSAYLAGRADSAASHLRAAITADPEMATAWMQLGEVYAHLLPFTGNTDSLADLAFTEARRLDSSAVNLLLHPIEIRLRRGDLDGATPLLARFRAAADTQLVTPLVIAEDCIRRGAAAVDWKKVAAVSPEALIKVGKSLAGGGAQLACAKGAFGALLRVDTAGTDAADARRFAAMIGMHTMQLAQNSPDSAAGTIDAFIKRWDGGASFFLLDAPFVPSFVERAKGVARDDAARYGATYDSIPYGLRLWELGVLEARTGRIDVAAAVATELHRRSASSDSTRLTSFARSLDAFVLLARGDSAAAERLFAEVVAIADVRDARAWDEAEPRGGERLVLAQLLMQRGQFQRAIDVATVFDSATPIIHLLYLPASLELRARAAKVLGDQKAEARYLARLATLRGETGATGG